MISRKKIHYPISPQFTEYLRGYGRISVIPAIYDDLKRFSDALPYTDPAGNETLWQTLMYPAHELDELRPKLTAIYAQLKIGGDMSLAEHLDVERIDFGEFGNSKPFRIRIINRYNDNFDHYYVKIADASRAYGLELEHILSPNRINYLINENTLIEEHIAGIPGDVFLRKHLGRKDLNRVRVAKEFVKFNERSFIRLLGDMRTVNYVVDVTPDFEETQYRVRPIDFDQQCYEGRRSIYLAQFFKDNNPVVDLVMSLLNQATIRQYQQEERTLIAGRKRIAEPRFNALMRVMGLEELSPREKVRQLADELGEYHESKLFKNCTTMGQIVQTNINFMLKGL